MASTTLVLDIPDAVIKWAEPERETLLCCILAMAEKETATNLTVSKGFLSLCSSCGIKQEDISSHALAGQEFVSQKAFDEFLSEKDSKEAIFDEMINDAAFAWSQPEKQQSGGGILKLRLYGMIGCALLFLCSKHKLNLPEVSIALPGGAKFKIGPMRWEYDGNQDMTSLANLIQSVNKLGKD